MANRNHIVTLDQRQQGQISIFFSASMVVMITIVAFIINIGLFVKAKINLQNATDAAAYAGASVQARQLTKIAYLNWEMRNVYKEWMYKYYVIGNLNIDDVENPDANPGSTMRYKLQPDVNVLRPAGDPQRVTEDKFNIPTICIHIAGSKTNICKRYSIPGLPEFGSSNLPGAEEASRAFMDALISTKVNDCVDRTRLNMMVANTWTYNVMANEMDDSLTGRAPAILSDRQGAWPRAVELAMRIRNLENVMNRPAETGKICATGSTEKTNCSKSITQIEQEKKLGNERIVKAFYSAYRNLGSEEDIEMKQSFTLTELPPKKVVISNNADASALLVPENKLPYEKQWVDLKLMMVNYAIFYAAMIPRADSTTSGACDVSKVAIPVPGYPLGFYKNPDVLTYYAVKGEAEFIGMFSPFQEGTVKLEAYSAAKPMGGRIGPMLFTQRPSENFIVGRTDGPNKFRSLPYITSYDFNGVTIRGKTYSETGAGEYFIPGLPLPTNSRQAPGSFWVEDPAKPVGGKVTDAAGVQFGVPNMVYDYETPFMSSGYTLATEQIYRMKATDTDTEQPVGLFAKNQFKKFRGSALSDTISPSTLDAEIARVKAPTLYEAANYLIPTPNSEHNVKQGLDSFGFISSSGESRQLENGIVAIDSQIYAPLYSQEQEDVLYTNGAQVLGAIIEYMKTQESGMTKYRMSMNRAAMSIWKQKDRIAGGAEGSKSGYERAARGVSDLADFNSGEVTQMPLSCDSLSGAFLYFYYGYNVLPSQAPGESSSCPTPLGKLLENYFSGSSQDSFSPTYYNFTYSYNPNEDHMKFMTAYMPGPFTGARPDGTFVSPLSSEITDKMRRNSYSTKFVTLDSLRADGDGTFDTRSFTIQSEGQVNESGNRNTSQKLFANPLETAEDLSSIKY